MKLNDARNNFAHIGSQTKEKRKLIILIQIEREDRKKILTSVK